LNVATVNLAELTGYEAVVDLARRAGLNMEIHATPAVALGAYEVTPFEIGGAYTIYANQGIFSKPYFVAKIGDNHGSEIFSSKPEHRVVLDPRVAFLMDNLMEEVVRSGTGAGIHGRGINFPVAGKTGTSHDGWFAGFTTKLICIVWVGFDDNRELNLEGAHSALPVWAEFMKRAHEHREYRDVTEFAPPAGVVSVQIDPISGQLATSSCPQVKTEYFIEGTQPVESCQLHGGGAMQVASWETGQPPSNQAGATAARPGNVLPGASQPVASGIPPSADSPQASAAQAPPQQPPKKKGFFGRIRDIFR
jgi:penicillin-binding protein 1B